MKKQINPTIKAHLIRGAFYLLLLVTVCAIPFALAQRNSKQHAAAVKTSDQVVSRKRCASRVPRELRRRSSKRSTNTKRCNGQISV